VADLSAGRGDCSDSGLGAPHLPFRSALFFGLLSLGEFFRRQRFEAQACHRGLVRSIGAGLCFFAVAGIKDDECFGRGDPAEDCALHRAAQAIGRQVAVVFGEGLHEPAGSAQLLGRVGMQRWKRLH